MPSSSPPASVFRRLFRNEPLVDSWLVGFGSWILFLANIQYPRTRNFDEFHYIPAAQNWLGGIPQVNLEHPPLAKLLIAIGLALFGDQPIGWRFMSSLFGALTVVGVYLLARALFRSRPAVRETAWVATLFTVFNFITYVQSRIAMLDTFMMAFLVWGIWALAELLPPPAADDSASEGARGPSRLFFTLFGGAMFGLSIACKWFSIVPFTMSIGLLGLRALLLRKDIPLRQSILREGGFWILAAVVAYFACFVPYLFIEKQDPPVTFLDIFTRLQTHMWVMQQRVVNSHPYMSQWWDWIILRRPIWYAFDREDGGLVRGVICIGNPFLMWGGLLAVAVSAYYGIVKRDLTSFFIAFFYAGFAFCWIAIPRKVAFYYYYYPAALMLGFAMTDALQRLKRPTVLWACVGIAFGLFIYFFPVLAALPIPGDSFTRWMWFRSWI